MQVTDRLELHKFVPDDDLWDLFETWNPADLQTIDDKVMLRVSPATDGKLLASNATGDAVDSGIALDNVVQKVSEMVDGDLIAGDEFGAPYDSGLSVASLESAITLEHPRDQDNTEILGIVVDVGHYCKYRFPIGSPVTLDDGSHHISISGHLVLEGY
jgi:hypothetical protein